METTNRLSKTFTVSRGKQKTVIRILLADDCRNGHEDFSLTADIYGDGRDVGGCCHEHILTLRPDLAPFAALHLSDYTGAPMHSTANAFYWFAGWMGGLGQKYHAGTGSGAKTPEECRRIFQEQVRATEADMATFATCGAMLEDELQMFIEDLGIPARWREEAAAAIAQLEEWTGLKFETKSIRKHFVPLPAEAREALTARRASGYWEPAAVAARKAKVVAERKQAAVAEVLKDREKAGEKLDRQCRVKLWEIETFGPDGVNLIYYDHTNEIAVNWCSYERLITKPEFDAMETGADLSKLPAGVKFTWQEKPRH